MLSAMLAVSETPPSIVYPTVCLRQKKKINKLLSKHTRTEEEIDEATGFDH